MRTAGTGRGLRRLALLVAAGATALTPGAAWARAAVAPELISVTDDGTSATGGASLQPAVSRDGRFVAFSSTADDLPGGPTPPGTREVYVRDRARGTTVRVSVAPDGSAVEGRSEDPSISADGRYLAFSSDAGGLVEGNPDDGVADVYVRDLRRGRTVLVSRTAAGAGGDGDSGDPSISADGRVVAYASAASDLVPGDANGVGDVFVTRVRAGRTTLASVATDGTQGDEASRSPVLSPDGTRVAFTSGATTLVPPPLPVGEFGEATPFVRDLRARTTTLFPVAGATQLSFSADGRFVAYALTTAASSPVEPFLPASAVAVLDTATGESEPASEGLGGAPGDGSSSGPSLSADGRTVAFVSNSSNLVEGDEAVAGLDGFDVFVRDLDADATLRASEGAGGQGADAGSSTDDEGPALSADGGTVAFSSAATDLAPDDTDPIASVFAVDLDG